MDEIEQMFEDSLTRKAFAEGYSAFKTGAANPYVKDSARAAWLEGYNEAKAEPR